MRNEVPEYIQRSQPFKDQEPDNVQHRKVFMAVGEMAEDMFDHCMSILHREKEQTKVSVASGFVYGKGEMVCGF